MLILGITGLLGSGFFLASTDINSMISSFSGIALSKAFFAYSNRLFRLATPR